MPRPCLNIIGSIGVVNSANNFSFYEFEELGLNKMMGCSSPGELRKGYAHFFWGVVHKYVEDGVNLLQVTQEGKEWISRLHSHVFECEHFILGDDKNKDS